MPLTLAALKTELETDPQSLGYSTSRNAGDHTALAALVNEIRAGATYQFDRAIVPAHEIFEAIVQSEWTALTATEKQRIGLVLGMSEINVKGTNTRQAFLDAFAAGTTTRANLLAIRTRQGSRAEVLWGEGTLVTVAQVGEALAS